MIDTYLYAVWLGFIGLSSALLEPTPFPAELQECYEYRSYNMTPSFKAAMHIQNICFRNYQYNQFAAGKVWSGPNITQEGVNYIESLFRQILLEANDVERYNKHGGRQKRQAFPGRFRREVRSPGAFQPFANCIQRLQSESVEPATTGRNTYQTMAAFHSGETLRYAHGGPAFAPWHRIYLLLLETACRAPIPYWDSGLDHDMADPTMSILWSDQFFGNGDGEVMNGPFRNMRTILGTPIIRNYGTGDSALFTKEGLRAVLSQRNYVDIAEPLFGNAFMNSLEGHHNGPHVWVGGHISALNSAPWDPVFYMHHAYVDAVWERFREQQVTNGINPETDYPRNPPPPEGHAANDRIDFQPYINPITNIFAMRNLVANLVRYEPFPTCENTCNSSPHLSCDRARRICVSRERPVAQGNAVSASSSSSSVVTGAARGSAFRVESRSQARAEARGPLPVGQKFRSSPVQDARNRADTIGTGPAAAQIRQASVQVRASATSQSQSSTQTRVRRDVFQNTTAHGSHQSVSSLERSFTNTFVLDGVVDLKRWAYVPVRIVYTRSPNVQGVDPTLLGNAELANDVCQTAHSGASKVFVASNGLDYYGNYKEFAIIDERQPVSVSTTAVGIKNPEFGEGEVLFTAYDSCGRPCCPLCLTSVNGQQKYKACSGAFKISSAAPTMYRNSYKEAIAANMLEELNMIDSSSDASSPPVTFVCGNSDTWPWSY